MYTSFVGSLKKIKHEPNTYCNFKTNCDNNSFSSRAFFLAPIKSPEP